MSGVDLVLSIGLSPLLAILMGGHAGLLMSGVALVLSIGLSPLLAILMGGHAGLPDFWCGAGAVYWPLPSSSNING
jgi:hypothetical protein